MARREQHLGSAGQNLAAATLIRMGIEMVEKIGTPVLLIPVGSGKNVFRVTFGEKVSGDHRGILPGGRSVLAETKTILDRNLHWSDLREHQPDRLCRHAELGGLSLLVWVHDSGVYVMQFPLEGFGPGKGVTRERAQVEDEKTRRLLGRILGIYILDAQRKENR
jgi:hypothetical protein